MLEDIPIIPDEGAGAEDGGAEDVTDMVLLLLLELAGGVVVTLLPAELLDGVLLLDPGGANEVPVPTLLEPAVLEPAVLLLGRPDAGDDEDPTPLERPPLEEPPSEDAGTTPLLVDPPGAPLLAPSTGRAPSTHATTSQKEPAGQSASPAHPVEHTPLWHTWEEAQSCCVSHW